MSIPYGVSSMVANLDHVLVQAPTDAFASAFDNAAHGYLHPVSIETARKEHDQFRELLADLGCLVHMLDGAATSPDLVYTYDPSFMTPAGAVLLRSGKETRLGEEQAHAAWYAANDIPVIGSIDAPGTVDGGDLLWLPDGSLAAGRTLRTNQSGIDQLAALVDVPVRTFDMPVHAGSSACLHLMSAVSFVSDTLAVVEMPLLPAGLYRLLHEFDVEMIPIPNEESASLGGNVLAVRPGVAVVVDGNPRTRQGLEDHDVEVHAFAGEEIAVNGTGGPTCLTRPICRS